MKEAIDLDDAPELDEAWFDRSSIKVGAAIVRRGAGDVGSNPEDLTLARDGAQLYRSILNTEQIEMIELVRAYRRSNSRDHCFFRMVQSGAWSPKYRVRPPARYEPFISTRMKQ